MAFISSYCRYLLLLSVFVYNFRLVLLAAAVIPIHILCSCHLVSYCDRLWHIAFFEKTDLYSTVLLIVGLLIAMHWQ